MVGVLTYGLLGELVLGPLWRPAADLTVYKAATSLAVQAAQAVPARQAAGPRRIGPGRPGRLVRGLPGREVRE